MLDCVLISISAEPLEIVANSSVCAVEDRRSTCPLVPSAAGPISVSPPFNTPVIIPMR